MVNIFSNSSLETKKIGEILWKEVLKIKKTKGFSGDKRTRGALILGLEGDLGGGKTTFLQGFAKGLKIKQKITSPTFVIFKKFSLKARALKTFIILIVIVFRGRKKFSPSALEKSFLILRIL